MKLVAYASLLDDYPRACFTRKTLGAAGRRFKKFFPSFGELCEFLDDTKGELRVKVDRLQRIAKPQPAPKREAEPEQAWTGPRTLAPEIEAALERCKAELAAAKPATFPRGRR